MYPCFVCGYKDPHGHKLSYELCKPCYNNIMDYVFGTILPRKLPRHFTVQNVIDMIVQHFQKMSEKEIEELQRSWLDTLLFKLKLPKSQIFTEEERSSIIQSVKLYITPKLASSSDELGRVLKQSVVGTESGGSSIFNGRQRSRRLSSIASAGGGGGSSGIVFQQSSLGKGEDGVSSHAKARKDRGSKSKRRGRGSKLKKIPSAKEMKKRLGVNARQFKIDRQLMSKLNPQQLSEQQTQQSQEDIGEANQQLQSLASMLTRMKEHTGFDSISQSSVQRPKLCKMCNKPFLYPNTLRSHVCLPCLYAFIQVFKEYAHKDVNVVSLMRHKIFREKILKMFKEKYESITQGKQYKVFREPVLKTVEDINRLKKMIDSFIARLHQQPMSSQDFKRLYPEYAHAASDLQLKDKQERDFTKMRTTQASVVRNMGTYGMSAAGGGGSGVPHLQRMRSYTSGETPSQYVIGAAGGGGSGVPHLQRTRSDVDVTTLHHKQQIPTSKCGLCLYYQSFDERGVCKKCLCICIKIYDGKRRDKRALQTEINSNPQNFYNMFKLLYETPNDFLRSSKNRELCISEWNKNSSIDDQTYMNMRFLPGLIKMFANIRTKIKKQKERQEKQVLIRDRRRISTRMPPPLLTGRAISSQVSKQQSDLNAMQIDPHQSLGAGGSSVHTKRRGGSIARQHNKCAICNEFDTYFDHKICKKCFYIFLHLYQNIYDSYVSINVYPSVTSFLQQDDENKFTFFHDFLDLFFKEDIQWDEIQLQYNRKWSVTSDQVKDDFKHVVDLLIQFKNKNAKNFSDAMQFKKGQKRVRK